MDCKIWVKGRRRISKGRNCKILVKRRQNSWDAAEISTQRKTASGKKVAETSPRKRQKKKQVPQFADRSQHPKENGQKPVSTRRQETATDCGATHHYEGGKAMEQKDACRNSSGDKAVSRLRKGTFYLLLASIWPTIAGRRRWARKGVEKRIVALDARNEENPI